MKMTSASVRGRAGALSALSAMLLLAGGAGAQQKGPRITPNFKDADITQLIEAVSAATGKNFIIDPRVRAQVTWLSGAGTALTPEQFYQGFLAVLEVHGFIAVPAGNIIKVLPDANMRQIPGQDLPNRVSSTSDEVVTQVIAVSNVSAAQLVPVLRPLMPQNAQLSAVTGANMLIISDRASNVSRMMRIVARIDQSGGSDIDVIPLQSATAADTVRVLSSLVAQGGDSGGPNLHLVADDRSNSVLISGDPAMRLKMRALIANLDTPLDTGGETLVRYLNYARAEDLATKLKEQISSNSSNNGSSGSAGGGNVNIPRAGPPATSAASATTVSLAGGTGQIWADKDTNALIITAPQRTMRALNAVIDKLDIRRAQVEVEAIIVEVSNDNTADLGINWILDGTNSRLAVGGFIEPVGGSSLVDLYNAAKTGTPPSASAVSGTTIAIGRLATTGVNFAAIGRALQGDSRTNVIAKPTITMRDNEESKIEVAQEVPFLTGQYTTSTAGAATPFQTIQREQVGTILSVTPQINEGDSVVLKVEIEVSSIAASSQGAVDLITNKRTVKTTVLIPDGGTLVIGGLIQDQTSNAEQRVPFLSRIPLVGELFRVRDTSKGKTNLMVFLQPHILHDDHEAAVETDAKYEYLRNQQRQAEHDPAVLPLAPFQKLQPMPPLNQPDLAKPSPPRPGAATSGAPPTGAKSPAAPGAAPAANATPPTSTPGANATPSGVGPSGPPSPPGAAPVTPAPADAPAGGSR